MGAATTGVPRKEDMYNPLLQALRDLGGSGTIDEIAERVILTLQVPEEIASQLHDPDYSNETELEYRLAWARTYLKNYGILERSGRGVWAIRADKQSIARVDPIEVNRFVHALTKSKAAAPTEEQDDDALIQAQDAEAPDAIWRQTLHRVLTTVLTPDAFERLAMRLLRESGFVHAEVTGRSGDGGIDGKGIARMAGVLSFHVVFQCKRYQGAVSSSQVRDFRGAMVGRADKGLLITTGRFSRDAVAEATREGAPPIDLIDGDRLADMLKSLKLGVRTELVERVTVDEAWLGAL
ncbi:restriction endonuclease : Restriction endonuclease OS=Desulfococcus multivorans DSM 2059 GN=dsmv_3687 PE=4 SV=1: Mrr_N: Mrr_cat [Gemmataceae bacterium]|nr:restriction endonuclease : Restriction endonuclease OS=Desulfococcus multivorans DSM 2059 GN=dsmv_3687 PE=4 SV=1: Mrr_N: Mrr_cat [Gemmataceae bacterium]VTT96412.1 restriction endonuclease : Restriction endonuclease OS=Desulfococcus multivorans DSM 2059 GN=dsmv_3687 PE=4 SV=1: Mrr_N: Mrr_cat [Gemmataceae bacterium]